MYMTCRPILSVTYPNTPPPTKIPTRLAAPMRPISVALSSMAGSRVISATPMIDNAKPSMNGPPEENAVSFLWKEVNGASSMR